MAVDQWMDVRQLAHHVCWGLNKVEEETSVALNIEQSNGESFPPLNMPSMPAALNGPASSVPWDLMVRTATGATGAIAQVLQQFWGLPVRVVFFGVSARMHYFWRTDDFHVSQLMLGDETSSAQEPPTALLRLSDTACSALLSQALGPRSAPQKQFSFAQLSSLEATVLNEFSRDVLSVCMKDLIRKPGRTVSAEQVHLIWLVDALNGPEQDGNAAKQPLRFKEPVEIGKIILSLPANAVRTDAISLLPSPEVPDLFFYHVLAEAKLYLGSTRMTLADLNQLEPGDMVVLEDSNHTRLALVDPQSGERLFFSTEIPYDPSLTIPYTQEFADMETQHAVSARQNLWDNLMIEVNAEFEPIKLPLKQLKQMSEGLVVEIGDVTHNKICLQVEGKVLAWGELIIVGDKFGIRVNRVESAEGGSEPTAPTGEDSAMMLPSQAAPDPEAYHHEEAASDENPDNFLNDDFDDLFDDEEDL
jgi:flagellar motor switch/type III secretory pathway protein FliN